MKRYWVTVIFKEYRNGFNYMDYIVCVDTNVDHNNKQELHSAIRLRLAEHCEISLIKNIRLESMTGNLLCG